MNKPYNVCTYNYFLQNNKKNSDFSQINSKQLLHRYKKITQQEKCKFQKNIFFL